MVYKPQQHLIENRKEEHILIQPKVLSSIFFLEKLVDNGLHEVRAFRYLY